MFEVPSYPNLGNSGIPHGAPWDMGFFKVTGKIIINIPPTSLVMVTTLLAGTKVVFG